MEYWFVAYKFSDDLCSTMITVSQDESPNVNWYGFVDAVKRELVLTCYTFTVNNVEDIIILNFIQVNKEDK